MVRVGAVLITLRRPVQSTVIAVAATTSVACLSSKSAILAGRFLIVTAGTKRLPVGLRPKQVHVAPVWRNVIDHFGRRRPWRRGRLACHTERIVVEVGQPFALPGHAVAALAGGLADGWLDGAWCPMLLWS